MANIYKVIIGLISLQFVGCGQAEQANSELVDIRTTDSGYEIEEEEETAGYAASEDALPSRTVNTGTAEFTLPTIDSDTVRTEIALTQTECKKQCNSYGWNLVTAGGEMVRLPNVAPGTYQIEIIFHYVDGSTSVAEGKVVVVREATTSSSVTDS